MAQLGQQSGGKYPTLSQEEWESWLSGSPEEPRLRYGKQHDLKKAIEDHPEGFLIDRDHPKIGDIKDAVDIFNLPGEGEGGPYFARPKPKEPLTS
jgi:hypothetical protein